MDDCVIVSDGWGGGRGKNIERDYLMKWSEKFNHLWFGEKLFIDGWKILNISVFFPPN